MPSVKAKTILVRLPYSPPPSRPSKCHRPNISRWGHPKHPRQMVHPPTAEMWFVVVTSSAKMSLSFGSLGSFSLKDWSAERSLFISRSRRRPLILAANRWTSTRLAAAHESADDNDVALALRKYTPQLAIWFPTSSALESMHGNVEILLATRSFSDSRKEGSNFLLRHLLVVILFFSCQLSRNGCNIYCR